MDTTSDLAWMDRQQRADEQRADEGLVPAATLHVLQLEPIKAKLGDKWEKLSELVHKLFEKTLRQIQGPADHFLLVGEMSYVVTFHDLSEAEASVACASVAKKVCNLLFGADIEDIAIRGLIGLASPAMLKSAAMSGEKIVELLEREGGEIIVTHRTDPAAAWHEIKKSQRLPRRSWAPDGWIGKAHGLARRMRLKIGFFPMWDLRSRSSASLSLSTYSGDDKDEFPSTRHALKGSEEPQIANFEIALLYAAAEYAHRVHATEKICALGVGVSYETLSGFHSRIHYLTALKAIQTVATCPLLLRIEEVPDGTPLGRLAEIVAMLNFPDLRVTIEFQSLRTLPQLEARLGVVGIGSALAQNCDVDAAAGIARKLSRLAREQKTFAFLNGLRTDALLGAALDNHIQFGSGRAVVNGYHYTGLETVPDLPLRA